MASQRRRCRTGPHTRKGTGRQDASRARMNESRAAAGVRAGRMACMPKERPAPERRPAGLLGQDQLVVAGVAQAIALPAVADQHLTPALQQAGAVQLALAVRDRGPAAWQVVWRMGGWRRIDVRAAGKHRLFPGVGKYDANDSHLSVNRQSRPRSALAIQWGGLSSGSS